MVKIFCLVFLYLTALALYYPMTGDELHSIDSVSKLGLFSLVSGSTGEGTTSPLYFLLLKILWPRLLGILPSALFVTLVYGEIGWLALALLGTPALELYGYLARPYALWVLLTWVFTKAVFERNKVATLVSGYLLALTTPFAALQLMAAVVMWPGLLVGLLPGILLASFYAWSVPEYPFVWPGVFRFFILALHHFPIWAILPIGATIFLGKVPKKYLHFLALQSILFVGIIISFWRHREVSWGFMISERYFVFLLPVCVYILIRFWREEWLNNF
jgi:hypothetical protein